MWTKPISKKSSDRKLRDIDISFHHINPIFINNNLFCWNFIDLQTEVEGTLKTNRSGAVWVIQLAKCLSLTRVVISGSWDQVLSHWALYSVGSLLFSLPLPLPPAHTHSLFQINKILKKRQIGPVLSLYRWGNQDQTGRYWLVHGHWSSRVQTRGGFLQTFFIASHHNAPFEKNSLRGFKVRSGYIIWDSVLAGDSFGCHQTRPGKSSRTGSSLRPWQLPFINFHLHAHGSPCKGLLHK